MAKVIAPLHSIGLKGRMADGVVFGEWRGIPWMRTFVMLAQPRTQRREQIWKIIPRVTRSWANLTAAERALWEDFAATVKPLDPVLGRPGNWSGCDAYVSANQALADAGLPLATIPPGDPLPQPPGEVQTPKPGPGSRAHPLGDPARRHPRRPLAQPDQSLAQSLPLQVQTPRVRRRHHRPPHPHRNPSRSQSRRESQDLEAGRREVALHAGGNNNLIRREA